MALSLDILGFGSKRKWAFQLLDREWAAMDIDIRRIDGGVKQLLFQWAQEMGETKAALDPTLVSIAKFSGFLMLGPELGARSLGPSGLKEMSDLLDSALETDATSEEDVDLPLEVRVVRLVLAAKLVDRDIAALVELETDSE